LAIFDISLLQSCRKLPLDRDMAPLDTCGHLWTHGIASRQAKMTGAVEFKPRRESLAREQRKEKEEGALGVRAISPAVVQLIPIIRFGQWVESGK